MSTARKLLILTPTAIVYGGVERIVEALNDGLPRRGFDVLVGLARGAIFHDPRRYRLAYPTLRMAELDARTGSFEGRRRALHRALDEYRPDLVLIARLSSALPVLAERKIAGDPVRAVFTIQGYEPNYFLDLARYGPFIDFCVTSGTLIADAASELCGFPRARLANIPGGVWPPITPVCRLPGAPIRLGYVGRLVEEQKRVFDIPAILELLSRRGIEFSCTVTGDGPAAPELKARVALAGLADRVRFTGPCDHATLYRDIYPNIDIFLHCAAWEGVSIAPREAMANGSVAVVSEFTGLAREQMFLDSVNVRTFPVGNVQRAAELVVELARDFDQWSRLSEAARHSQTGIRSHEGALDSWADCLGRTMDLPQRKGRSLPEMPRPAAGRLDRWIGEKRAETVRRLLRRGYRHAEQGGEWPHWTGGDDPELRRRVEEFGQKSDRPPAAVGQSS